MALTRSLASDGPGGQRGLTSGLGGCRSATGRCPRGWSRSFVVASVTGLVFGGLRVADAISTSRAYGRTAQLAALAEQATVLAQAMENERDLYAGVAAYGALLPTRSGQGRAGGRRPIKADAGQGERRAPGDPEQAPTRGQPDEALAGAIGAAFPASVQNARQQRHLDDREHPRAAQRLNGQPPSEVITDYSQRHRRPVHAQRRDHPAATPTPRSRTRCARSARCPGPRTRRRSSGRSSTPP